MVADPDGPAPHRLIGFSRCGRLGIVSFLSGWRPADLQSEFNASAGVRRSAGVHRGDFVLPECRTSRSQATDSSVLIQLVTVSWAQPIFFENSRPLLNLESSACSATTSVVEKPIGRRGHQLRLRSHPVPGLILGRDLEKDPGAFWQRLPGPDRQPCRRAAPLSPIGQSEVLSANAPGEEAVVTDIGRL